MTGSVGEHTTESIQPGWKGSDFCKMSALEETNEEYRLE
jgi:hypothetical protein